MSNKDTEEMEAKNIAHLVGRMEAILEMIEFYIGQIELKKYQEDFLMEQVNEAKAVNDIIFEVYKKNELDRIKKTYDNGSDENK